MAHKGRPYEFLKFRDLRIVDDYRNQVAKRYWFDIGGIQPHPNALPQSTPWISYTGVVDYDAGTITYTWPPGGLQLWPFQISITMRATGEQQVLETWMDVWNEHMTKQTFKTKWFPSDGRYIPFHLGQNEFIYWEPGHVVQEVIVVPAAAGPFGPQAALYGQEAYFPDP